MKTRWKRTVGVCAALALCAPLLGLALHRAGSASRDAVVYDGICGQLLENTTAGRQAFVGSAWRPPLNAAVRLPIAAAARNSDVPFGSLAAGALFGALSLCLLAHALKAWGMGWPRFVIAATVAANPLFVARCIDGSSVTTQLFMMILTAFGLMGWVSFRKVRFLVYCSLGAGLLLLTSFESGAWVAFIFVLLLMDQLASRTAASEKGAVLLLALTPPLYIAGLWLLLNWLIMDDWLYFLRSVIASGAGFPAALPDPHRIPEYYYVAASVPAFLALVSLMKRNRAGIFSGALCVALIPLYFLLVSRGMLGDPESVLLPIFPLAAMAIGFAAGELGEPRSGAGPETGPARARPRIFVQLLASMLALVPAGFLLFESGCFAAPDLARVLDVALRPSADSFEAASGERNTVLPRIERHVLLRSRFAKVFVCGYQGFALLGRSPGRVFEYSFDFNFEKARADYRGHALFLLVRRPEGAGAADSMTWKYDRIFELGAPYALYDGDWGKWRLFEIVQAPRPKTASVR